MNSTSGMNCHVGQAGFHAHLIMHGKGEGGKQVMQAGLWMVCTAKSQCVFAHSGGTHNVPIGSRVASKEEAYHEQGLHGIEVCTHS